MPNGRYRTGFLPSAPRTIEKIAFLEFSHAGPPGYGGTDRILPAVRRIPVLPRAACCYSPISSSRYVMPENRSVTKRTYRISTLMVRWSSGMM